jgi:general secretion pathway protein G
MEVMLVLVILGILGSMAAVFISGAQKEALQRATRAEIKVLEDAVESYNISMLSYPTGQDGLNALMEKPSNDQNNRWRGPYIKKGNDLKDPWGNEYQYEQSVDGTQSVFIIYSAGPDGSPGNEDDIRSTDQF